MNDIKTHGKYLLDKIALLQDWRPLMQKTREVAGMLADAGKIEVLQKGQVVDVRNAKGPIRLRLKQ